MFSTKFGDLQVLFVNMVNQEPPTFLSVKNGGYLALCPPNIHIQCVNYLLNIGDASTQNRYMSILP